MVDVPELNETLKFLGDLAPSTWYAGCDVDINIDYFKIERHNGYYNYIEFKRIAKILSALYNLHQCKSIPIKALLERLMKYKTYEDPQEYYNYIWDNHDEKFHISQAYLNYKAIEYIGECVYKYCLPLNEALYYARQTVNHKMIESYERWQRYSEMCEKYENYDPEPNIEFKQV